MKNLLIRNKITAVPNTAQNLPSLATCILMDLLGFISYGIPVLGELLDIVWAPISAIIFMKLFGFRKGFLGGLFNFVEEALPGLDFIPTFTITWFIFAFKKRDAFGVQGIKN